MKIFKHLRAEWFRYGFETLAVVVGILNAHMESKLPYHDSLAKHFGYMSEPHLSHT